MIHLKLVASWLVYVLATAPSQAQDNPCLVILAGVDAVVGNPDFASRGPDPRFDLDRVWQCVAEARGRGYQAHLVNELLIYEWDLPNPEVMKAEMAGAVGDVLAEDPQVYGVGVHGQYSTLITVAEAQARLNDFAEARQTLERVAQAIRTMTPSRNSAGLALNASRAMRLANLETQADAMLDLMRDIAMQLPVVEILEGINRQWETRSVYLYTLGAEELRLGRIEAARQDMDLAEQQLRKVDPALVPQFHDYRDWLEAMEGGMSFKDARLMIERRNKLAPPQTEEN